MLEQGKETVLSDTCVVYDLELIALRKQALSRLAIQGISEQDLEIYVGEAVSIRAETPISMQDRRLKKIYEGAGASMKSFFQQPQFSPPEHGDISF